MKDYNLKLCSKDIVKSGYKVLINYVKERVKNFSTRSIWYRWFKMKKAAVIHHCITFIF